MKKVYLMGFYHALIISNELPLPTPLKTTSARPLRGWAGGRCQEQTGRGGACVDLGGVAGRTDISYGKFFSHIKSSYRIIYKSEIAPALPMAVFESEFHRFNV